MRCSRTLLFAATIVALGQGEEHDLARRLGFNIKDTRKLALCKCTHPGAGTGHPQPVNTIECSNGEKFSCLYQQECFNNDPFPMPLTKDREVVAWIKETYKNDYYKKCPTTEDVDTLECMNGEFCDMKTDPYREKCCHYRGGKKRCQFGTTKCARAIVKEEFIMGNFEKTYDHICAGPGQEHENCDDFFGAEFGEHCNHYVCPTTSDPNMLECMDGAIMNVGMGIDPWDSCNKRGGRRRCPKTYFMCERKTCSGDHCCKKSIAECGFEIHRECPSYNGDYPVGKTPDNYACRYWEQDGQSFNEVMTFKSRHAKEERKKLADAKKMLQQLGYEPMCPTKDEILQTPLLGRTGNDRKARWDCPDCTCGCHIEYGASVDETNPLWVPVCTQSKGNWRFPYPHVPAGGLLQASMIESLSNFANDAEKEFTWTAPTDSYVSGFWTEYNERKRDRVFKFHSKNFNSYISKHVLHQDMYTTSWCNTEESGNAGNLAQSPMMNCRCRAGYAVVGFESKYHKGTSNDRQWKLQCAKLPGTRVLNKLPTLYRETGRVNNFGDEPAPDHKRDDTYAGVTGNKVCRPDEVVCGLYGHHLDAPHDDRIYGIHCCRVQIAAQQCTIVQIEITEQVIAAVNEHASKTHADKISVNNCGNPLNVKNVLSTSQGMEIQQSSTFELSKSAEKTFTMSVAAEVSMEFAQKVSTPFQKVAGGVEAEMRFGLKIGTNAEWSRKTSRSETKVDFTSKVETETFNRGFEYETPGNTKLTVTSTAKEYEGQIYWTGNAKCMYNAGGTLITLETRPVSGSWKGAQVRQADIKFEVQTCASDGFKMEYERYCEASDRMKDKDGNYRSFKTIAEAKQACEKDRDCGGVFDEGCTNDASEAILLCNKHTFLEFSKNSCVLVKTVSPGRDAPKCPVGYDGECKDTKACPAKLEDCGEGVCCSTGWKADCDMKCAEQRCVDAKGKWIASGDRGLDRNVHHYVCEVQPQGEARVECSCTAPGSSQEISCTDGHQTSCSHGEYCSNSMAIHRDTVSFETADCKGAEIDRCRAKKHLCALVESEAAKALRAA